MSTIALTPGAPSVIPEQTQPSPGAASNRYADVVFNHPAALTTRASSAELLALAKGQHALDPSVFDDHPPFFSQAEISSNRVDAYFTRMHETSLRNYAADAQAGISVLNSHLSRQLGFGRSISGEYIGPGGNGVARVLSDFYTVPGINLNGVNTDDLILGIRSGLVKDVSIGFYGGTWRCSVCGLDLWDWDCSHVPGMSYTPLDKQGNPTEPVLCVGWVEDARLAEYSLVYDGATPGAAVLKAQQEADGGRLRPEAARVIEARYRVALPGTARVFGGVDAPQGARSKALDAPRKESSVDETTTTEQSNERAPDATPAEGAVVEEATTTTTTETRSTSTPETTTTVVVDPFKGLRSVLAEAGIAGADADEPERAVRALVAEVGRLRPLADDGKAYRVDLVAEALAEGVRAVGEAFAAETYRGLLETAPLATIKRMRDDWSEVASKSFVGRRATQDEEGTSAPKEQPRRVPASAFAG
jgi:hypothetical protein